MNKKTKEFLDRHGIPEEKFTHDNLSEILRYGEEMIERKTDGSAFPPKRQYQLAQSSAKYWKDVSGGKKKFKVLDIGCGQGYHIELMRQEELTPYGLNISLFEAELASHGVIDPETKVMKWQRDKNKDVIVGSAMEIPFKNESLDGLASYGVLMMLPHTEKERGESPIEISRQALREMYRVLKKGGHLDLVTFSSSMNPNNERTEDYIFFGENNYFIANRKGKVGLEGNVGIRNILEDIGFKPIKIEEKRRIILRCTAYK
jgi:ubiquinone/menaquinone biosynthesis C-methylase UbiE